jgi:hypothetical protein
MATEPGFTFAMTNWPFVIDVTPRPMSSTMPQPKSAKLYPGGEARRCVAVSTKPCDTRSRRTQFVFSDSCESLRQKSYACRGHSSSKCRAVDLHSRRKLTYSKDAGHRLPPYVRRFGGGCHSTTTMPPDEGGWVLLGERPRDEIALGLGRQVLAARHRIRHGSSQPSDPAILRNLDTQRRSTPSRFGRWTNNARWCPA